MEPELLGTSGGLNPLRGFFQGCRFWSVNAKIACSFIPPGDPKQAGRESVVTATLIRGAPGDPYTRVDIGGDPPVVTGFGPAEDHDGRGFVFTGVQLVSPRIWEFLPPSGFSHFTTDVYKAIWAQAGQVTAHVADGEWREFSTVRRYLEHHLATKQNAGEHWGQEVSVSPLATVRDCILWDHITIEEGARLRHCVLTDGVVIRSGRVLERMAVVPLEFVGEDARGEVLDDNLVVAIP
jgi:NDP-sugar pyrophosphorylase family protein